MTTKRPPQPARPRPNAHRDFAETVSLTARIVADLADEVASGGISRAMAVGNAMVSLGITRAEAERLFPFVPPKAAPTKPQPPQVIHERVKPIIIRVPVPPPPEPRLELFAESEPKPATEPRTIRKVQTIERDSRGFPERIIEESTLVDGDGIEQFAESGPVVREVERDERGFPVRVVEE